MGIGNFVRGFFVRVYLRYFAGIEDEYSQEPGPIAENIARDCCGCGSLAYEEPDRKNCSCGDGRRPMGKKEKKGVNNGNNR